MRTREKSQESRRKLLSSGSFYAQIEPFTLDGDDDDNENDSMIDFLHWQQAG